MAARKTLAQQALAGTVADATCGGFAHPSTETFSSYDKLAQRASLT